MREILALTSQLDNNGIAYREMSDKIGIILPTARIWVDDDAIKIALLNENGCIRGEITLTGEARQELVTLGHAIS